VREFFQSTIWDPDLAPTEIREKAEALLDDVPYLDCYTVTALHENLSGLEEAVAIADQMVSLWVDWLRSQAAAPDADPSRFILDNWTGRPVHPLIVAAFAEARARIEQPRTLLDVCLYLAQSNGWGPSEEAVLRSATVDDFMQTILRIRGEELKMFLYKNLDLYANRGTYANHFGSGPANFLEACRRIRSERAGTRWASLVENLFRNAKLDADLNAAEPAAAA
jgi:hypothetical protein